MGNVIQKISDAEGKSRIMLLEMGKAMRGQQVSSGEKVVGSIFLRREGGRLFEDEKRRA